MADQNSFIPEELLQPSDAFAKAADRIGLHWWYWDHSSRKIHLSQKLIDLLGFGPGEFDLEEKSMYRNIHPDDVEENYSRIRNVIDGKTGLYEMEFRLRDQDGNWQWFYNRGNVISRDENGNVKYVGGITMDISGQYRHILSRLGEQEKFEFIFRHSNEAIMTFEMKEDRAGAVLDANPKAMEIFGKGPDDLNRLLPEEIRHHELIGDRGLLFRQVLEKGFGQVEMELTTVDGVDRWLNFTAHAFDHTGRNLAVVIISDRTSRKRTEAALRGTERLYQTLFEAAEDPIGLFTPDRDIILINSAFYRTFGYGRKEFMKMGLHELIHPDDRCILEAGWEAFKKEGIQTLEYRCRHKSGSLMHVSSKNVLISGEQGEGDLVLMIIRDVSDRRKAMEELKRAKRKAEESDQLKSAFLANMSHEIRTPMNSIVGFSNLLVNPELDEGSRNLYVKRIIRNSELLLVLISDIVDLAKIESGQLTLVRGKQRITSLLREMEEYAQEEADRLGRNDLRIIRESDCEEQTIEIDVLRITQILKNLLNNAVKFTEKGYVTIGCNRSDREGFVCFFIKDTGIGIAPEHFRLIFDQFRQIDGSNTRKFGGTGLGLAICRNLAVLMGGTIRVESEEGKGSEFYLELPLKADSGRYFSERAHAVPHPGSNGNGQLKVMVVDDEEDSVELFREFLKGTGHSVITAPSGYEALRIMEKGEAPDLVFMDVQMPILSGTDTMKIMKSRNRNIRVVAQSAHALLGDRARFLREGYDAYLAKPYTREQVNEILSNLV